MLRGHLFLALLFVVCSLLAVQSGSTATMTLVAQGSAWRYLDNGTNQGTAWRATGFNDSAWNVGNAQLGYGDGDEATVVSYGPSSGNKYITTYFRHSFAVADASAHQSLTLRLLRDDGAVVYLNGTEVFRSNMPGGTITYTTLAPTALDDPEESALVQTSLNPDLLVNGTNVLAVEVHQAAANSSDLSLDLKLTADDPSTLVGVGTAWKYLDNGSNQGTAWRATGFNDSAWNVGNAQLGYGDGDEATVVSYGPNSNNKYITTYFRRSFDVADPSLYEGLTLRLLRDDGAVVYLNGTEVFRSNMPGGTISYTTRASTLLDVPEEVAFVQTSLNPGLLANGTNVLAVEVHQGSASSGDLSFDLGLIGFTSAIVTRGPYLQMGTPTSVVVRWRTDAATDSWVRYGPSPGSLLTAVADAVSTTEHEVTLTGLTPNTQYYYSVGTATRTLEGNNPDYFFITAPAPGSPKPTRVWVLGDSGTPSINASVVRDAYYNLTDFLEPRHTDLWLMLGDNAYDAGTDGEYQVAVFDMYPEMLRKSCLWPARGNHETDMTAYQSIFTLPTSAEAGGTASDTERYYSFDYANIHFICLDSDDPADRSATGTMATWLQNDLAATTQDWIIAYWHAPPYSKGSHDSDTDIDLIEMRENIVPILENGGVDLVLCGHSHSYERSFLLDGHYGMSGTLIPSMIKDSGSGREDGDGAYTKPLGTEPHQGTVYVVAGSSSKAEEGWFNHPAMFTAQATLGSMVLDIEGNRLRARFLSNIGTIEDYFTLVKETATPTAPSNLTATAASSSQIDLAWADNADNEDSFEIERSLDGTTFTLIAAVGASAGTGGTVTYADTGLSASTIYYYRVRAANSGGGSGFSNTANAATLAAPPDAPTNLTATAVSASQIDLAWTDGASNEDGFKVERSTDGTSFTQIATVGVNVASYSDTGLSAATTYYYRMRAYNAGGDSAYSDTADATTLPLPPGDPSGLAATAVSSSQIDLAWTDNSSNEDGFKVERSTDGT
ncbi:MAG: fibronectin type III domain-containing protein, partial [Armatimonadetes bacterium]|nr:fibronectin type III domain-containing protein [Armatimonadota bacterium]